MENKLHTLTQKIVETADPECVYLMTAANSSKIVENIFSTSQLAWQEVEHYGFLVLLKGGNDKKEHIRLQDKIEQRCQHILPTSILVLSFGTFNKFLLQGNLLVHKITSSGKLLYNAKTQDFAAFASENKDAWEKLNLKQYLQWFDNGNGFLAAFDLFLVRKDFRMAAFNLHQAAEQFFLSIFQAVAGFTIPTHNLYGLHRLTRGLTEELAGLFPHHTHRHKERFRLLAGAYYGTRYDTEYKILYDDLIYLQEEVKKLYLIARALIQTNRDKQTKL